MKTGASSALSRGLLSALFLAASIVVVASFLFILLMGFGFVFFTPDGIALSNQQFPAYVFLFLWVALVAPAQVGSAFLLIWVVYFVCFVVAWKWRESFHKTIRGSISNPFHGVFKNFLLIFPLISSMLLTAVSAIIYLQASVGVATGEPEFPPTATLQEIFFALAYAPAVEELGFRLIPLGLYTILYVLLAGKTVATRGRLLITAAFFPDGAKRSAGLRNVADHGIWHGISIGEWVMIIATSILFGYAHIVSDTGWEVGKITSVSVQALFFAVAYFAYGFEAPILLHWYFNYYLFFFDPSVVSRFFPSASPLLSAVELIVAGPPQLSVAWSPLGIFGWTVLAYISLDRLLKWRRTKHEATQTFTTPS